jgi:hypothetical protein
VVFTINVITVDTAYAQHNGKWYLFDDTWVKEIKDEAYINVY